MSLRIAWINGWPAVEALSEAYAGLVAETLDATVFNGWAWMRASAARTRYPDRNVVALTAWDGRRLVACLLMKRARELLFGLPARTLRLLGHPLVDRMALPVAPDAPGVLEALLNALTDPRASQADAVILSELPRPAGYAAAIGQWSCDRCPILVRHCSRAPVLDLTKPYAVASNGLRQRLSRARKRLAKAGSIDFERHLPTPAETPPLLDAIAAVEDDSWKGAEGTGIFSTPGRRLLFDQLSADLAAEGRLEITLLRLDGDVASYRYGFRVGRRYLDYNFAHRQSLDCLSVGRVLLDEVVSSAADSGISLIDASRGSLSRGNILQDWTNDYLEHDEVWLFSSGAWGGVLGLALRKARPAAKRLMRRTENA